MKQGIPCSVFLLDPFPRASCHCIRKGIVSTHLLSTF